MIGNGVFASRIYYLGSKQQKYQVTYTAHKHNQYIHNNGNAV